MRLLGFVVLIALGLAFVGLTWASSEPPPLHDERPRGRAAVAHAEASPPVIDAAMRADRRDASFPAAAELAPLASNEHLIAGEPSGAWQLDVEVLDEDGEPVRGARVALLRPDPAQPGVARAFHTGGLTEDDGIARLAGRYLGERIARVDARDPSFGGRNLMPASWRVRLEPGAARTAVVLRRGLTIAGRVAADELGAGRAPQIELAAVHATSGERCRAVVDAGEFAFVGLEPGVYSIRGERGCEPFVFDGVIAGSSGVVLAVQAERVVAEPAVESFLR